MTATETTIPPETQVPSRRFSRNVALTLAARVCQVGLSLTANVVVARWLGESGLGSLAVINVTVAIALQVASLGLPSANIYFVARDRKQLGPIWANSLVFGVLAGIAIVGCIGLLLAVRPQFFGEVPPRLLLIAATAVPFQFLTLIGLNLLLGLDRVGAYNIVDTLSNSIPFFSAAITLLALGGGLALLIYGNLTGAVAIGVAISILVFALWRGQPHKLPLRPSGNLFLASLRYGLKFHLSIVANLLLVRVDLLLVNHYSGTRPAGIYAAAAQIGTLLLLLPGVVSSLLFPKVTAEADPRGWFAMRVTRHLTAIMFLACLATVPAALLLPVLYGAKFAGAVTLLLLLLPGVLLLGIESVLVQHFSALGLPKAIPIFWVIALAVNLGLNFLFIPRFGATAAAINSSIGYGIIFLLVALYFRHTTGNGLANTFIIRADEIRELGSLVRRQPGAAKATQ